jgi:MTH538 TIR-like domain (DUF1863)
MSTKQRMRDVQAFAERVSARKVDATRHKCFVSYHVADIDEVTTFLDDYGTEFIPRSVGVTEEDDFVGSTDDEYIKRRIREEYLTDSTVTIVLLGGCTWARKFVDWELSSSLRNDAANRRSGLLAIPLPSRNNTATLPDRVHDNWVQGDEAESYASYRAYPVSTTGLRNDIEDAFVARTSKSDKVDNSRALRTFSSSC